MQKQIKTKKIYSKATVPYWPDYNGIAEQVYCTVIKYMYTIFIEKNLPNKL